MSVSGQHPDEPSRDRFRPTWRVACTFSLLAAAIAVNLTDTLWAVSGPISSMVEFVLRYIIWFYAFGLCALSMYLAVTALRGDREEGKRPLRVRDTVDYGSSSSLLRGKKRNEVRHTVSRRAADVHPAGAS